MARKSIFAPVASRLPSHFPLAAGLLLWVFLIHLAGLALFSKGFLLTRFVVDSISSCSGFPASDICTLPPTHSKAVVLIIDALRFDFISPNPPSPVSPYYHHALKLPSELTTLQPSNSFIFNTFADPPTTTLQRLKGIATGSLPTFIDVGSNFAGTAITEDNFILQLRNAGKRIAFMGDNTWTSVFPTSFEPNMTFPYDSFNVEDLHTVDEGVIEHLFPLLKRRGDWDFLIGHFLGVDHVGHRYGPNHRVMKEKLQQMDDVLRKVVQELDDDTLLIVFGDHGMDSRGDHGGDGDLETNSATWIYSKNTPLSSIPPQDAIEKLSLSRSLFPGSKVPERFIQQIDLASSLSLLLGLPLPFNNLGSIIPELFLRPSSSSSSPYATYRQALSLNAQQIWNYLLAYRSGASGGDFDKSWIALESAWQKASTPSAELNDLMAFTRLALRECRVLWAQFDVVVMWAGLSTLAMSILTLWSAYARVAANRAGWENEAKAILASGIGGGAVGTIAGVLLGIVVPGASLWDTATLGFAVVSQISVIVQSFPEVLHFVRQNLQTLSFTRSLLPIIVLIIHAISFTSNSFTIWEDRIVLFLLLTLLTPIILQSPSAPTTHLRWRLFGFGALTMVCVRLISASTICREEQQPNCHVTFYSSSMLPVAPLPIVIAALPVTFFLPTVIRRFLAISKSDKALAPMFLNVFWRLALSGGALYWILEWVESSGVLEGQAVLLNILRTAVARIVLGGLLLTGYILWWYAPLCVDIQVENRGVVSQTQDGQTPRKVVVVGFANAYGSSYLLFVLLYFALLFTVTQPTGQVALALTLVSMLAYLEVVDSQRDTWTIQHSFATSSNPLEKDPTDLAQVPSAAPTFSEPVVMSLFSMLIFFATGHQAALPSIQWKTAFVGFPTVTYPFSPTLVVLNTFGPLIVPAVALPLLGMWNVSPVVKGKTFVLADTLRLALGMMVCWSATAVGAATSAAILRRHLMVWKIFAPRFMLGGVALLAVDVALIFAVGLGAWRVSAKVKKLFFTDV